MQKQVFTIGNQEEFNRCCLEAFRFQYQHNAVYRQYVDCLGKQVSAIKDVDDIPFLPIEFFKTQRIYASDRVPQITFSSSGTTGMATSKHYVADLGWYEQSFRRCFELFYGKAEDMAILALLPSYLERAGSSLIYMVDDLIRQSTHPASGYFLYDHDELYAALIQLKNTGTKTLLIGVTYALLDFCERYRADFPDLIVMETGGMKGRRKEMIREELHQILCSGFGVGTIHSEYGMTELLSQAYSFGNGLFRFPPWMKILIRDTNDPLSLVAYGRSGAINVIDLANLYSCPFIATQDLGKLHADGSFEVLGRFDNSDIRGCNLLVQ
ncbi:acyl-protein synthetase LuxE [Sphingobacterium allocomposti]|uniref:Acyl-protein synthetase LuxE n=1 Tax=Sphingobacterium allocomposti TaxID=415956 RepID=A0A5S5DKQ3_9SPHI|nr:acyl transferase [Sphingobacterium composti Yoo et al. 2007 non Ten et al. 2007]TYP96530.1 acyl-protein synthetase LuxE [Sphingobacterium composti Yoo et al. 2007 non Ten et al. 2007]